MINGMKILFWVLLEERPMCQKDMRSFPKGKILVRWEARWMGNKWKGIIPFLILGLGMCK
jgi:hypothetical protein